MRKNEYDDAKRDFTDEKGRPLYMDCEALKVCRKTVRKMFELQCQELAVTQESYRIKDFDVFDWDEIEHEIYQATAMHVLVRKLREQHHQ